MQLKGYEILNERRVCIRGGRKIRELAGKRRGDESREEAE